MLSCFAERYIWPTFLSQIEIHSRRCNVDQTVAVIHREVVMGLALKVAEHFLVIAFNPTRCRNVDRLKQALNLVLVAQTVRDNFELQRTNSAEN